MICGVVLTGAQEEAGIRQRPKLLFTVLVFQFSSYCFVRTMWQGGVFTNDMEIQWRYLKVASLFLGKDASPTLMRSGIVEPGHQPHKGRWLMTQHACHRPGVGQCTFLVILPYLLALFLGLEKWGSAGYAVAKVKKNAKISTWNVTQFKGAYTSDTWYLFCVFVVWFVSVCFTIYSGSANVWYTTVVGFWVKDRI